jgi:SAM-dependent methyltransferase
MFTQSAEFYDAIYHFKDYRAEAERLHALIQTHIRRPARTLLDVACGTGRHLTYLRDHYAVEGLDFNRRLLTIASGRHPGVAFHRGDMTGFNLHRRFDVVVCLFAAIAYTKSSHKLAKALRCLRRHAHPGGLVAVEPFIQPEQFEPAHVSAIFVDRPDLKVARVHVAWARRGIAVLPFHYLVATPRGVRHFTERHELALFTHEQYLKAFHGAGLETAYDEQGLGRGLYIGIVPVGEADGLRYHRGRGSGRSAVS